MPPSTLTPTTPTPVIDPLKPGTFGTPSTYFGQPTGGSGPQAGKPHTGIDLPASPGTPVYAATGGVVIRANGTFDPIGGNEIVVYDPQSGVRTVYAHLQDMYAVAGQTIPAGTQIGTVGDTGIGTTGAHLHFEVWQCADLKQRLTTGGLEAFQPGGCTLRNPLDYLPSGLKETDTSIYQAIKATVALQADGRCPVGYHENNGHCELDTAIGAAFAGGVNAVTGWADALGKVLGFLLDPLNWLRIFAVIAGAALVFVGGRWVYQAT